MEDEEKAILRREQEFICREVVHAQCFADVVYDLMTKNVIQEDKGKQILVS